MKLKLFTFILLLWLSFIYVFHHYNHLFDIVLSILLLTIICGYLIYRGKYSFKKKSIIVSILISIIFCIFTFESFIKDYKYEKIEIQNLSDDIILLDSIYLNGEKVKIHQPYAKEYDMIHNVSFQTEYKIQNKNTDEYKGILKPNKKYIFDINKKDKVEIQIQRKNYDFNLSVNGKVITIDSFNYDSISEKALQMGNYNYSYYLDNSFIHYKSITNGIVLILLLILNFNLVNLCLSSRKLQLLLIFINVLEFNPSSNISFAIKFILIILLLLILQKTKINITSDKNQKQKLLFLISSLYISFSIVGNSLINEFSFLNFLFYIILVIFIYLFIPFLIDFIDSICSKVRNVDCKMTKKIFLHRIIIFCIVFIILYLYQFIFYPYIYLADGVMQVLDITNHTLSNWHPYLHTLLLKLFYIIFGNLNAFIYFRIMVYALLLNTMLFYFHRKGMKLLYVYLIAIIFTIMPTTGVIMVTLLKDVDFVIAFIALTFYIYLIYNDFEFFHSNKLNYIWLLLSLIAVGFFRHNGIFVSIIMICLLLFLSIQKRKKILGIITILFLVIAFILKNPLYKQLKVENAPKNFNIATMIHGLDYIMVEDKDEYDEKTYQYLTKNILSNEDFKLYYDKYNIDILLHYNTNEEDKKIRNLKLDQKEVIQIYLKQILKSPIYLLKDRLYGTDIIWNVVENDRINVLKYQTLYDEFDVNYKATNIMNSNHSTVITHVLNYISSNTLLNTLFFRAGFYIDILIIFINYQIIKKKNNSLLCLIPLVTNLLTLFIAMHYQAFRYVWMIPGVTMLFILMTIFDKDKNKKIDKQ